MDLHQLAAARSLAYHRVVAERLRADASILNAARARVARWLLESQTFYALRWREVLAGDVDAVAAVLTERSERAAELRQSSPFAGVLSPAERWHIWRLTRDSFVDEP